MKKVLLMILLLFLTACGGTETAAEPTAEPAEEAGAVVVDEEAEADEAEPEPTAEVVEEPTAAPDPEPTAAVEEEPEEDTGETAVDLAPEVSLADASLIRTEDWAKGAAEPLITIIEYGDFQ